MSSVEVAALAAAACVILPKQQVPRRVRLSLKARARSSGSEISKYLNKDDVDPLSGEVSPGGRNLLRMASCDLEHLIVVIGHKIAKQDTNYRAAIPVKEKLAVLRFLASGDSYTSLSYLFEMSKSTISLFVPEFCKASKELPKDSVKVSTK
ncbi:hypothetical protein PR048_025007 [Dryococelus australis]|uniref:Transposase n=1 Tax=Dryococelus australis TaxID=614101 RepID=A0ABQ9GQ54_9NEOP|nr:hypothetical protein PR048_025007 [Dryococelus australis]